MSFFKVGDKFGVNQANLMKKLGLEDASAAGNGEVRLFRDGSDYMLKVWNGSSWDIVTGVKPEPTAAPGTKEFTESDIFTVPTGITQLRVTLVAGGGGGGQGYQGLGASSGSGGGAGEYHERATVNVTPGEQILVTIGKGGRGQKWPLQNMTAAENGGDSSFGSYIAVNGGFRGNTGWKGGDGGSVKGDYTGGDKNNNGLNNIGYSTSIGGTLCTGPGGGGGANVGNTAHGGNGGSDTHRGTTGGQHGSGYGAQYGSGAGGGAGWGGNGGKGGDKTSATGPEQTHLAAFDGQNGLGYGAGGGGGANGAYPPYNYGYGGDGYHGYCKVEWGF